MNEAQGAWSLGAVTTLLLNPQAEPEMIPQRRFGDTFFILLAADQAITSPGSENISPQRDKLETSDSSGFGLFSF